jgi:predicted PurR-regulated permease PerM
MDVEPVPSRGPVVERRERPDVNDDQSARNRIGSDRVVRILLVTFLVAVALYFARVVFEPIAFALFGMALVWPFQRALEARLPKSAALGLTVLLALFVIFALAAAIVWSVDDVVHWTIANITRFQTLYNRWTEWLDGHGIHLSEGLGQYDVRTFINVLQAVAREANYFVGFCLIVFLLMTFGLTELVSFRARLEALAPAIGQDTSRTAAEIAEKIRKYMLIRTLTSGLTGLAVFGFTISVGLDLAIAWGIISFVLNYIPFLGTLIAVALPVLFSSVQFESWQMVVFIFGSLYLIQFLIGSYLEPIIAGRTLSISPLVMLVSFFFWAFLWGIPGAFIGIPVTIALLAICERNSSLEWLARLLSAPD